jgi:nucleoside-diphosphate-sugar epimerase
MRIAIAGAHGQIALRLTSILAARGDTIVGLIRNPDHTADVRHAGASPVVCDLEHASDCDVEAAIAGTHAVVFAAGAGPGSGGQRKLTMDRDGALKLVRAARAVGTRRYVMISGVGAEDPPRGDDVFSVYLRAKSEADAELMSSGLEWTILRPGGLTDDPGAGTVRIDASPHRATISRDDVATVLAAVVADIRSTYRVLYLNSGGTPIAQALEGVLGSEVG